MEAQKRVGVNVRRLRIERALSQEELAFEAKVHQTYLSGVETGRRNPSVAVLERIAKALKVDIAMLFAP